MIPPSVFPPELQPLIYLGIFPTIVVLLPIAFILFWKFLVPSDAKNIFWARFQNVVHVIVATDAGTLGIERGPHFSEGVVEVGKKKEPYFLPRPIEQELVDLIEQQSKGKANPSPATAESIAFKRYVLRSTGKPIYLAHSSKGIAVTPQTLLGLQNDNKEVLVSTKMAEKIRDLGGIIKVLLPIDPAPIKKWFSALWNESQIDSYGMRKEKIGFEQGKGELKRIMIPVVAIMILFVLFMVFMMAMK